GKEPGSQPLPPRPARWPWRHRIVGSTHIDTTFGGQGVLHAGSEADCNVFRQAGEDSPTSSRLAAPGSSWGLPRPGAGIGQPAFTANG
ncbi:MAG: hypothetical protein M3464_09335, partial [Chloroflexota bacterium]|nr:hypothetical protein [Chloroflexota bacterium]